ncbi:SH3 domain-containing protein [Amphritea japonica]|uniref:SH3b domain-containing protein n=1 Tax=Amphritea japonica ATCC BAA-1530 TaxID=1278309 RepID=A0A7R6P0W8_9GAMM|nr:SH3 domain-containing protein [Amphritea japonica]BBB24784.1 hypothetical protein AMJAP_0185 [Amphritea japonica ATCC BAA-1530]
MILLRSFIIFMLFLITTQPYQLSAAERLEVEVGSTILNIREIRSTSSPVIGVLNQGDRLTVTTTDMRDWLDLDDGRGFISINYVNVLSRTPVLLAPPEEESIAKTQLSLPAKALVTGLTENNTDLPLPACSPQNTDYQLQIKSSSKTCRKNLSTLGYESCQLVLNLSLTSACINSEQLKITCSATALAINSQNNQNLYELTNTRLINNSVTDTSILLDWLPISESTAIQKISLSDGQCRISK